jgi:L-arabinokinase
MPASEEGVMLHPDLQRLGASLGAHHAFFAPGAPIVLARAPGRIDLMGGIADYSGALVLQYPLALAAVAAAQPVAEPLVTVRSLQQPEPVVVPLAQLFPDDAPIDYAAAQRLLTGVAHERWAAYCLGTLVALGRRHGVRPRRGVRVLLDSQVPVGKGVSSSAAIEVATMLALAASYQCELTGAELAHACQDVENLVVGAPCGIMDQMTAACGQADMLLALRCQPAILEPPVALPADLAVWGIDSGVRHDVGGADYTAARVAAFMGYRILAEAAGLTSTPAGAGRVTVDDPLWGGYLANVTPGRWHQQYAALVPAQLDGAAFLARYGGITDHVTQVDPARTYGVAAATAHPILEHHRVSLFRALLQGGAADEAHRRLLGELMYQSHAGYSACGLGTSDTDLLVGLVRELPAAAGVYGARITGGGSGGTVALLARRGADAVIEELRQRYEARSGRRATLLSGSSPGAIQVGTRLLSFH